MITRSKAVKKKGKDIDKVTAVKKPITPEYNKNFSFKLLQEKNSPKKIEEKLAVYDFTYDPTEEPLPQKKKRKRVVQRKAVPKPKPYFVDNNYNKNISKALNALRSMVKNKSEKNNNDTSIIENKSLEVKDIQNKNTEVHGVEVQNKDTSVRPTEPEPIVTFNHESLNYTPVASPNHNNTVKLSLINDNLDLVQKTGTETQTPNKNLDPVNIQEELSFFDDIPLANSSMNTSRYPQASPWRAKFEELPIKWGTNTYVKPNMTPAVESSFINFENNKKKHVYTNILDVNTNPPEIVNTTNDNPNWKQTSILSYIKGANEKNLSKRNQIITPTKENSLFNDLNKTSGSEGSFHNKTPEGTPLKDNNRSNLVSQNKGDRSEKRMPLKQKNDIISNETPLRSRKEAVATLDNFFGFDESSLHNQENITPNVGKKRKKMKSNSKALKKMPTNAGPTRAKLPALKENLMPQVELVDILKHKTDVSHLSKDKDQDLNEISSSNSGIDKEQSVENDKEDSPPIPLFEDVEVIHHNKVFIGVLKYFRYYYSYCR